MAAVRVALIWAMSANGVIGRGHRLPWRLPKDMQFFQATTMGKPVIMGRKTFESMKAPLPGRTNIVLTRDPNYRCRQGRAGIRVVHDLDEALAVARAQCEIDGQSEVMVAGGAAVYADALDRADRLYVTRVDAELEGDTFFPTIDFAAWREVSLERYASDETHSYAFTIAVFERVDAKRPNPSRPA
jgi:dihydrofolate reductase